MGDIVKIPKTEMNARTIALPSFIIQELIDWKAQQKKSISNRLPKNIKLVMRCILGEMVNYLLKKCFGRICSD